MGFLSPPSAPPAPAPLPPPPTRDDPAVEAQRKAVALAEKRRAGRRASILTSTGGTTGLIQTQEVAATPDTLGS